MSFDARCFWYAKDLEKTTDYEDAFDVSPQAGRAAIADGVSSAIFSRRWAQLLTSTSVAAPPNWDDPQSIQDWLTEQRRAWAKSINVHALPWNQRAKLEQSGGAYAAFLWMELLPTESAESLTLRALATGDCCLFHVRNGDLLTRFPLTCEADFERDPVTLCSSNRNRNQQVPLVPFTTTCLPGDWVVLSSDALAKWLYRMSDAGEAIDWTGLWRQDAYAWTQRVSTLRELSAAERIRVDDTTLVILRVGEPTCSVSVVEASLSVSPTDAVFADDHVVVAELVDDETTAATTDSISATTDAIGATTDVTDSTELGDSLASESSTDSSTPATSETPSEPSVTVDDNRPAAVPPDPLAVQEDVRVETNTVPREAAFENVDPLNAVERETKPPGTS